jgi:hypothetical protein
MSDRETNLRALAAALAERDDVRDAWVAKSFTDRLLVVELPAGATLSDAVARRLAAHVLRGSNEVYETGADHPSFAGSVGGDDRHRFVDVRTRGDHQSYVVE